VHDALVTWLVLRRETTDEAMGMLVLRFPAVASVEMKSVPGVTLALTDQGGRAVSSLRSLTPRTRRCAGTAAWRTAWVCRVATMHSDSSA
jgi:hypothetical protein